MVREFYQRDYPRPQWTDPRFSAESHTEDGRYHEAPLTTIGDALRERCKIPAQKYFVAALLDDGSCVYYGGPNEWHKKDMQSFFNTRAFELAARRHLPGTSGEDADYSFDEYGRHSTATEYSGRQRGFGRQSVHSAIDPYEEDSGSGQFKARKRPRNQRRDGEGEEDVSTPRAYKEIRVDDSKQIWDFCDTRFKNLQQTACKLVAKAWVKLVEPKKQSTHPYTGSDEKAPDWWPKPWGPSRDEKVRHKEPDHLYKKERVHLLNHILAMIVEPIPKQHPDIQKLKLNVSKLEEATFEALSAFFLDKDNPGNARKKPYLKEIFKVARAQEKFKGGEVDGDCRVYVMADDKFPDDWQSGDENMTGPVKQEEASQRQADRTSASSNASPQKTTITHGMIPSHGLAHTPASSDHSPTGGPPVPHGGGGHFLSDIPVRSQQQTLPTAPILTSDLGAPPEVHQYVDTPIHHANPNQSLQGMYSTQQNPSRRGSSLFHSPTDYTSGSPGSGPGLYQQPWQQQHGPGPTTPNSAAGSGSMYAFASQPPPPPAPQQQQQPQQQQSHQPHQHHAHQHQQQAAPPPPLQAPYVTQGAVQVPQHAQPYMGPTYVVDGLPRDAYDQHNQNLYRAAVNLPAVGVSSAPSYSSYLPHDGRNLPGPRT